MQLPVRHIKIDFFVKIEELNLKDIVSIKENTPELEDIIFELFSNFKEKEQEK